MQIELDLLRTFPTNKRFCQIELEVGSLCISMRVKEWGERKKRKERKGRESERECILSELLPRVV
jgi:hypothetical protein